MLEAVGLTADDEAVYNALVRRSQATVAEIAEDCRVSVHTARRVLEGLLGHGLVTRASGRPTRYVMVPPESGIEALLRDRENALRDVRSQVPALMDAFRAGQRYAHPAELVEVVMGRDQVGQRWAQVQRATRAQMRGFDKPPYAAREGHEVSNPVELDMLARGVKYRVVYDTETLVLPGWIDDVMNGVRQGEQARVGPDLPMKLAISDDRVAIIPLLRSGDESVTASYLVHPSPLLDALIALFEITWERSVPLRTAMHGEMTADGATLSDEEEHLLTLLASGLTDAAASRTLGWSERTVQRHVRRLMLRLGVQTRFQIGMEATRRGWI